MSDPLRTLVVDGSDAFVAGAVQWIATCADLKLVGTAKSGPEALEAVNELAPDLVIVDAVLPGIDGFRLTRTLKERPGAPLVVLVTFHTNAAARDEAHAAGADAFLGKHDFTDGFEAILREWAETTVGASPREKATARPARRGSQIEPGL